MDGRDDWDDQDDLDDNSQLDPADTLEPGGDPLDEGYSPPERPLVIDGRADEHEDLGRRLDREVPDVPLDAGSELTNGDLTGTAPTAGDVGPTGDAGDGIVGAAGTDGVLIDGELIDGVLIDGVLVDDELIDDEVGDDRAGRLMVDDLAADPEFAVVDVGIDGAGASSEEAAVHLIPTESDR